MKAIVCLAAGGPEVLSVADVADPRPGEGEVVIEIRATAVNRADVLQRRGLYPPPPGVTDILGLECSGVVSELGPGVASARVGERVMALLPGGGYAERVAVPERLLMTIPDALSFEEAAAVPEAFLTASEALFTEGDLAPGDAVLITAAASGVGSAAVQLALHAGVRVVGSASAAKLDFVRGSGAVAVDREREDYVAAVLAATGGAGANVLVDFVGGAALARHQACLAPRGRHVVVGLLGGSRGQLDLGVLLSKRHRLLGLVMRTRSIAEKAELTARFVEKWLPELATGRLAPRVERVFPLSEAAAAHRHIESNASVGKIVLSVEPTRTNTN